MNNGLAVCPMRILYKDHIYWTLDMGTPPPSRSVVSGNQGGKMGISELISMILEPVANKWEGGFEVNSTGDFVSGIESLNEKVRMGREDLQNLPAGWREGTEEVEDLPEGWKDVVTDDQQDGELPGKRYKKGDIRNFGRVGEKLKNEETTKKAYEDNETLDRVGRMRMMRTKMKLLRKKNELQPVTDELKLKKIRMRAKTITGEKIIHASRMESSKVQKTGERVIVGADVEGLYPALEDLEVANICYNAILRSKINFNNIDYRKASIYVAMNISGEETTVHPLGRVLPRRKHKTSSRSWVTGKMKNAENSWNIPEVEWTDLEKRLMMAEMTRMGVIVMMNSHIFRWDGKLYLQRHGGPIGLRATCAVARVTMLFWDEKLACVLKRNHIDLDQGMRYMDDVRLVLDAIHEGWRWTEDG